MITCTKVMTTNDASEPQNRSLGERAPIVIASHMFKTENNSDLVESTCLLMACESAYLSISMANSYTWETGKKIYLSYQESLSLSVLKACNCRSMNWSEGAVIPFHILAPPLTYAAHPKCEYCECALKQN